MNAFNTSHGSSLEPQNGITVSLMVFLKFQVEFMYIEISHQFTRHFGTNTSFQGTEPAHGIFWKRFKVAA